MTIQCVTITSAATVSAKPFSFGDLAAARDKGERAPPMRAGHANSATGSTHTRLMYVSDGSVAAQCSARMSRCVPPAKLAVHR
ncbi:hypothetical protein [Nonomuraea sp. NPDC049158]|uniref:hypothetical protein n=1 Tax=Nonomuraea sp. NPDC049158 TaxID=3155649 RepID=UPI0033FE55B6